MTRRRLIVLALLLLLVVVAGAAGGWWYMAVGRYPLAGSLSHDFGDVPIGEGTAGVSHTFHLRNHGSEPVVIEHVRPSCGCTAAKLSTRTVEPGGTVDVDVTLHLARAGEKRTSVALVIRDFGIETLWMVAVGKKERSLWPDLYELGVAKGKSIPLLVFADIQSSDEKPEPLAIEAPEGFTAKFIGWELARPREPARERAAEWRGRIRVEQTVDEIPPGAVVRMTLKGAPPLEIPLVRFEPGPAPPPDGPADAVPGEH